MAYARGRVFRNAIVTIDSVVYTGQVTKAILTPDTSIQTMKMLDGSVIQDRDATTWTMKLAGVSDRGTGGLALALDTAAAAGVAITAIIQTKSGTGNDKATVSFIPVQVDFGGEQGSFNTFDAEFAVVDQPTFTQS